MNLHNVFGELEKSDPEVYDRLRSAVPPLKALHAWEVKLQWPLCLWQ